MPACFGSRPGLRATAVLLVLAGCTGSGTRQGAGPTAHSTTVTRSSAAGYQAVPGGAPIKAQPCIVALPEAWQTAIRRGTLWSGPHSGGPLPGPPAPGGSGVLYSQAPDGLGDIVIAGRGRHTLRAVGKQPQGYAWSASNTRWIAFVAGNGPHVADYNEWSMWLWDSQTGRLREVGRNPVDVRGHPLVGDYIVPVLTDRFLYWIQAAPDVHHLSDTSAGSEVVQYNLATGRKRVLYDGVAAAVGVYRGLVLFTAVPPGPKKGHIVAPNGDRNMVVRAINEQTGKEVPAPKGLTAGRDDAFTMVGNNDLVIWSRWQGGIAAWRPSWGVTRLLVPDGGSGPYTELVGSDSLGLYRQFLVFRSERTWVFDLRTDSLAPLTVHNSRIVFGGGHYLSIWESKAPRNANSNRFGYSASLIDLAKLPDLPGCPAK